MTVPVTASMLYDLVSCPHRVTMDVFADSAQRDEPNPFVQLLWEKGNIHEKEVVEELKMLLTDLSIYAGDEKERRTLEAMHGGEPLIYSGRMQAEGIVKLTLSERTYRVELTSFALIGRHRLPPARR